MRIPVSHTPLRRTVLAAVATSSIMALSACGSAATPEGTADGTAGASDVADTANSVSLNVFAASSTRVLNDALDERLAQLTPPVRAAYNNGGSAALVQQVIEGAPADLLLTASAKTMQTATDAGIVEKERVVATNELVMIVPQGNPAQLKSADDITDDTVFVMCDPTVPCGDVSTRIIADQGLTITADSLEGQVADVLGKVVSGEADAGWVYSTDAQSAGDKVEVIALPGADQHRNEIWGAVVKDAAHPDAAEAVLELITDDFGSTWQEYGFAPAP